MSHTPGPWSIDRLRTANGAPIITADSCWMGMKREVAKALYHSGSEDPEVRANARLIAAAPELLEALKELLDFHGACHTGDCPEDDTCNCMGGEVNKKVNAAIAKAEGRQ